MKPHIDGVVLLVGICCTQISVADTITRQPWGLSLFPGLETSGDSFVHLVSDNENPITDETGGAAQGPVRDNGAGATQYGSSGSRGQSGSGETSKAPVVEGHLHTPTTDQAKSEKLKNSQKTKSLVKPHGVPKSIGSPSVNTTSK